MPSSEITTVVPANSTERPAVSMAMTDRLADVVAAVQLLSISGDDQQRVVDADAETDHHAR